MIVGEFKHFGGLFVACHCQEKEEDDALENNIGSFTNPIKTYSPQAAAYL